MKGVEILASKEVVVNYALNWKAALIVGCIVVIVCVAIGLLITLDNYNCSSIVTSIGLGILFGTIIGMLAGIGNQIPIEYETQYKITISDEVSMNEFSDKYEVLDQEGKIYIVRERE